MPTPDRASDEVWLHVLTLHRQGASARAIGRITGLHHSTITRQIRIVTHDDCLHDPIAATAWWHLPTRDT